VATTDQPSPKDGEGLPASSAPSSDVPGSSSLRTAAISGGLAGGVALFVLLAAGTLLGANGLLEAIHNGVTRFIPLDLFDAGIATFGSYAKGFLFAGVSAAVIGAGALLAVLLVRLGSLPERPRLGDGIFAGTVAFLVGEAVVLPIFGQGFLGTSYNGDPFALHVPFLIASAAYGLVLAGLWGGLEPPERRTAPPDVPEPLSSTRVMPRRTFLGRTLAFLSIGSIAGSVVAVASRVLTAGSVNAASHQQAQAPGGFGPTPVVTPIDGFYVVAKDLFATTVDPQTWRLRVSGLIDHPVEYARADIQTSFTRVEGYRTLQCISNLVTTYGDLIGNQRWAGIRLRDVLDAAGVQGTATYILWRSADGYTESLPLEVARDERTWLADEMGPPGTPLTAEHGFPLRVLIAGRYGMKQPKYLTDIVLADHDEPGFWEQRSWDETAAVRTYSRIDEPQDGDTVEAGAVPVFGVASAGDRGIAKVEVSTDGGSTWLGAELEESAVGDGELSWRRWRVDVHATPGRLELTARATDGQGNVQDATPRPTLPSGATGLHEVSVTVVPASAGSAGARPSQSAATQVPTP
jgi:DMSO/TMAO reductase YedYZ molybdopterin-dependent catalytic subunit